jgi:hypothetical protein
VSAIRRLQLRAGETLSDRGRDRLRKVFDLDDPTGKLQTAWKVKEQLRALLRTGSLQDAAAAKDRLGVLVERAAQPETTSSGAQSAAGGRRSKSSSSPAPRPRRPKRTTPPSSI